MSVGQREEKIHVVTPGRFPTQLTHLSELSTVARRETQTRDADARRETRV